VTVDPTGKFAYVANYGATNVSAYAIGSTGALTQVQGSPFRSGSAPMVVTLDPTGKFAYTANAGSSNISAYTVNSATGMLTQVKGSPYSPDAVPFSVVVAAQ